MAEEQQYPHYAAAEAPESFSESLARARLRREMELVVEGLVTFRRTLASATASIEAFQTNFNREVAEAARRSPESELQDIALGAAPPPTPITNPAPPIPPQSDGKTCPRCGNMMQRTGTCHSCPSCGESDGCG